MIYCGRHILANNYNEIIQVGSEQSEGGLFVGILRKIQRSCAMWIGPVFKDFRKEYTMYKEKLMFKITKTSKNIASWQILRNIRSFVLSTNIYYLLCQALLKIPGIKQRPLQI